MMDTGVGDNPFLVRKQSDDDVGDDEDEVLPLGPVVSDNVDDGEEENGKQTVV